MTFDDAIASLGAELGFSLPVEDGVARLEAACAEGEADAITITISEMQDAGGALLSAEVGEAPAATDLRPLLEANHIFAETAGATLAIEDGRVYFEQYVPISFIGRGEGAPVVKLFAVHARNWRLRLAGTDGAGGPGAPPGDLPASFIV